MTPEPVLEETVVADSRGHRVAWLDPPYRPPLAETTQALGLCFTPDGLIVLVTWDSEHWTLPGGTREAAERLEQTLAREVREEACARVIHRRYLGCQHVEQLHGERARYYQTRFWARVELDTFTRQHEMTARRLVPPDQFLSTLFWGRERTARLILQRGVAVEQRHRRVHGESHLGVG